MPNKEYIKRIEDFIDHELKTTSINNVVEGLNEIIIALSNHKKYSYSDRMTKPFVAKAPAYFQQLFDFISTEGSINMIFDQSSYFFDTTIDILENKINKILN